MKVQKLNTAPPRPVSIRRAPDSPPGPPPKKDTSGLTLPPGNRFHWDPQAAKWALRARDVLLPLAFRIDRQDLQKLPQDASFILAGTHQHPLDGLLASTLMGKSPYASMIDIEQFRGTVGKLFANTGGIPVDRHKEYAGDFPDPVAHSVEVLNQGHRFLIYPEGGVYPGTVVYPIKSGLARIGISSTARYAVPLAQHYARDPKSHPVEALVGSSLSAAVAGAGIWAARHGGLAGAVAGVMTGLVGGLVLGAVAGASVAPKENIPNLADKAIKWGGVGALATAVVGGAIGCVAPGAAPWMIGATSGLTGLVGLGLTYQWTHRPLATLKVGEPVDLKPYRDHINQSKDPKAEWKESLKLTADFYEAMKATKFQLTGVASPFRMDHEGKAWGQQPDGSWAEVERNSEGRWEPVQLPPK
ncbi:1-acyl-sn-glycerol-3-phosphate acyltransferase [bacterium]|nr:1-acyl-sn-glycerol-3-phosphate acyltransferase [bacterium]